MTDKKEHQMLLAEAEALLAATTNVAIRDRIDLRDAICAYLAAERADGTAVATVLRTVEAILKRAEERAAGGRDGSDGYRHLARRLIDWCLRLDRTGKLRVVS